MSQFEKTNPSLEIVSLGTYIEMNVWLRVKHGSKSVAISSCLHVGHSSIHCHVIYRAV